MRLPEHEISIAEERGPVRTFKCLPELFEHMRKNEIREGCYIDCVFDIEKRVITSIEFILLEGFVTKWAPKYAFVHTPILPQVKLGRNNRVADCKFIHNPPTSLSSTYLNPRNCDFSLENNMEVRFSLCVNLKKTDSLRNPPYLDLKAVNVQKPTHHTNDSRRSSASSMATTATIDTDSRIDSWLNRRMSSPRNDSRSPKTVRSRIQQVSTEARSRKSSDLKNPPADLKLDEGFRRRGGSAPVTKEVKRGPSLTLRKPEPASAPKERVDLKKKAVVTPLKEMVSNLPENYEELMNAFKPASAKDFDTPPRRLGPCLRCQQDNVECTHRPPHSRKAESPAQKDLCLIIKDKDDENERLRQQVESLRLQLRDTQQQQIYNSPSNVQPGYLNWRAGHRNAMRHHVPNVPYQHDLINFEHIFTPSPSVSPSSSPVPDQFLDPEKFIPYLTAGGQPSSTRSDILGAIPTNRYDRSLQNHQHYGTPFTHSLDFISDDDFLNASKSATSPASWANNSEQLSSREYLDYYEPERNDRVMDQLERDYFLREHSEMASMVDNLVEDDGGRRSPRDMEVLGVPPLGRPPKKIRGERRTPNQHHTSNNEQNISLKRPDGKWSPMHKDDLAFTTPSKRQHYHHSSNVKHSKKQSNKSTNTHSQWENLL